MPTVYIHCGAPKTGTSYLQVLFAKYSDMLRAQGIIYPHNAFVAGAADGKITSGNGVEMANYIRPELPHNIADKIMFITQFDNMLAEGDGDSYLFSSEFLVFPQNERTTRLCEVISKRGYEVKIIYLVRDYANAARSSYSQEVKRAGEARDFETFLKTWDPYYNHHINLAADAFGAQSLSVYNYEEHKSDLPSLFFGQWLQFSLDVEMKEVINRSLNGKELELLRLFNQSLGGKNARSSTFASDALMSLPANEQAKYLLSRVEFHALQNKFSHSLTQINDIIIGRKIKISDGYQESTSRLELNDFERFTMAVLSKLVNANIK
jgi:hypothetical protein